MAPKKEKLLSNAVRQSKMPKPLKDTHVIKALREPIQFSYDNIDNDIESIYKPIYKPRELLSNWDYEEEIKQNWQLEEENVELFTDPDGKFAVPPSIK